MGILVELNLSRLYQVTVFTQVQLKPVFGFLGELFQAGEVYITP